MDLEIPDKTRRSPPQRPSLGMGRIILGFIGATILLMISVPIHDALIRPWPNTVYSVSADGMNIGGNGQIRFGDGGAFALKVAAAVVKMWSAPDNRTLMVELNSGGGD